MLDPQQMLGALGQLDDDALTSVITQLLQSRPECAPAIMAMACPDLTYAPTRALTDRRCSGVMKGVSDSSQFASIHCPELQAVFGCDVLVDRKQVGALKDGSQVSFAVTLTKDNDPQAFDLMLVGPAPSSGGCGGPDMAAQMAAMAAMGGGMPGGMPGGGMPGGGAMNGMDMSQMNPMMEVQMKVQMNPMMAAMGGMGGLPGMPMDPASMAMMQMGQMMPGQFYGGKKGDGKKGGKRDDQEVLGEYFGIIKSYNPEKGFGFIACDALKEKHNGDVYLHQRHVCDFQVGAEVKFQAYLHQGRLQGRDLQDCTGQVPPQQGQFKPVVQSAGGEELGNFVGTIKSFNVEKGFGFIESADLKAQGYEMDAFLHKDFLSGYNVGELVSFSAYLKDSKLRGRDLQAAGGGMGGMMSVPPPPMGGGVWGDPMGGMSGPGGMMGGCGMDMGGGCDMMKGKGMMGGFGDGCGKGKMDMMKGMMMSMGKGKMGESMMGMDGFGGDDNAMKRMKMM